MPASGAPLGLTPFGPGTPATATVPPSGRPDRAIYIDPVSGDYDQDLYTDQLLTMPPVRQRFLLLVRTLKKSSSALPDFGLDLPEGMDDTFEMRVRASIRKEARLMTEVEQVARIDDIQIRRLPFGRVSVLIAYTDLTIDVSETIQQVI